MKAMKSWAAAAAMVALTGAAQAALINRGGGMIYDSTRNITWLADLNYAHTSGHNGAGVDANGRMNWYAAMDWAANPEYGGYSDWRLPTTMLNDPTCSGGEYNYSSEGIGCLGSEMGGLFNTELGRRPSWTGFTSMFGWAAETSDDTPEQIANQALFRNLQEYGYWSSTIIDFGSLGQSPYYYLTLYNFQGFLWESFDSFFYAIAVRDGNVAPTVSEPPASVPEPQSLALVLLALGAAVGARKRRPG